MPKTCSTCIHWLALRGAASRNDGPVGECRASPPARDFAWPRTTGTSYCSTYASAQEPNYASAAPVPSERSGQDPRASAPQQLSLDATPESGAAPLPATTVGKPTAGRGSGNRPRRDPARTAESCGPASAAGVE